MDLIDVYRVYYPATGQCTFFSAVHGTFTKIENSLGHKASLNKCTKIEITSCIVFKHNAIKLELNNKRDGKKHSNNWRLSTHFSMISGS
jgi:hypothetical protein